MPCGRLPLQKIASWKHSALMHVLNRQQSREVDRMAIEEWGIPGVVLMENAGRGVAELIIAHVAATGSDAGQAPSVAICCGGGNNGGDGFVIARHLQIAGIECRLLLFSHVDRLRGDAAINCQIARRAGIPLEVFAAESYSGAARGLLESSLANELRGADVIVDAMLGTGATGNPRTPFDAAIRAVNSCADAGSWVLAVDVPSGLDCDTGSPGEPAIRAHATATFVAAKPGLLAPQAAGHVGELSVISIGVPPALITELAACGPRDGSLD